MDHWNDIQTGACDQFVRSGYLRNPNPNPNSPSTAATTANDVVAAVAHILVGWHETEHTHLIKAYLPGMKKEDVKIEVEDGRILQISGELKKDEVEKNDKWHCLGRHFGTVNCHFRLPENANVEEMEAKMERGMLTVTVRKSAETKPKIMTVHISGN